MLPHTPRPRRSVAGDRAEAVARGAGGVRAVAELVVVDDLLLAVLGNVVDGATRVAGAHAVLLYVCCFGGTHLTATKN